MNSRNLYVTNPKGENILVPFSFLQSKEFSLDAKGLLCAIYNSFEDYKHLTEEDILKLSENDDVEVARAAIKELVDAGYISLIDKSAKKNDIEDEEFYAVFGWMINKLGLRGTELCIYAILFKYIQCDGTWFTFTFEHLANFADVSISEAIVAVASLQKKGLIIYKQLEEPGVISVTNGRSE